MERCPWCEKTNVYLRYHDEEWGVPVINDQKQFEFLVLESAQAGLSWLTILNKRKHFRAAYMDFDVEKISRFGDKDLERLLNNPGIVRNRLKIMASINNAQKFIEIQKQYGSFSKYIWAFVDFKPVVNKWESISQLPVKTLLSETISGDLKKRGFKFFGSTVVYAHLQATGLVNDHLVTCFRYKEIIDAYPGKII